MRKRVVRILWKKLEKKKEVEVMVEEGEDQVEIGKEVERWKGKKKVEVSHCVTVADNEDAMKMRYIGF